MNNNRMKIIIISLAIVIVIIFIIVISSAKKRVTFKLIGDENVTINYGDIYSDPGVDAKDWKGRDLSDYVSVDGAVNPYVSGVYKITYQLNYNNLDYALARIVMVGDMNIDDFDIVLNGDDTIYLLKGSNYFDEGAYVVNKIDNSKIWNALEVEDEIDTQVTGEQFIKYSYKHNGIVKELQRKIIVFDIPITKSPAIITNENVTISMDLSSIDDVKYVILPDNSISLDKNVEYIAKDNGDYLFKIFTNSGDEYAKLINIDNIIDSYSCIGEVNRYGTTVSVISPSLDDVVKYEWVIDGVQVPGSSIYRNANSIKSASVKLTLTAGEHNLNCDVKDNLIYHFKYDEFFERPYIECNSYTERDRIVLDAKLKSAIDEAGKGTRAGVAEAGRFITGALDYKIRYLGPKKENFAVGRYPYVGLNIGKSDGWGCRVSGYTQGIDCTHFAEWVFRQNDLNVRPFDGQNVEKTSTAYNKIRAGDLLLSPCPTYNGCWGANFRHVGVVIGVDDKYIYVAEATTDKINAVVVTKWEKYNMPTSGKFSQVKFVKYDRGDGKYTDMWVS